MTEFGFDRRNGELLVGAAAIELRQEEAGPEILDVPTLLKTPDFPFKHGDFSPSDTAWNADACIELGRWTLSMLTETEDMPPALNKEHIRRLRVMGIGPGLREVTRGRYTSRSGDCTSTINSEGPSTNSQRVAL